MTREYMPIMTGTTYEMPKMLHEQRVRGSYFLVISIPWDMIKSHEQQAMTNHSQSLDKLASRGGLSPCEALAILEDRRWHKMENANDQLYNKMMLWFDSQQTAIEQQST